VLASRLLWPILEEKLDRIIVECSEYRAVSLRMGCHCVSSRGGETFTEVLTFTVLTFTVLIFTEVLRWYDMPADVTAMFYLVEEE
jgi:hypothetical protein